MEHYCIIVGIHFIWSENYSYWAYLNVVYQKQTNKMPLPLKRPCYESDKWNQQSELDNFLSNPSERLMLARNDFFLRLNEHRHSGLYCDICLVAEGQSFPAHRIVLHSIMPEWVGIWCCYLDPLYHSHSSSYWWYYSIPPSYTTNGTDSLNKGLWEKI